MRVMMIVAGAMALAACSGTAEQGDPTSRKTVSLRTLTDTSASAEESPTYRLKGHPVATPSDTSARYYVLFQKPVLLRDTVVAVLRQERNHRVSYARVEVDCARRLFHVLGVGNRRAFAETNITYDGPLRSIENLPLRQDLSKFICEENDTPLAART